ncbi:hypothetical protein MC7420_8299 [Coleofasciculus chthonoplastes PCC 7420]|uniref:Uncharacterized protein n=1 Tax=Coleofasciculus chthonoplastes PCC 7420 TaxID=118168 RepID=B4W0S4_9CYAN|nr:hypothetical protein MC7420_8299 [Coleofasciculus chthonoplastes PCC 7420]
MSQNKFGSFVSESAKTLEVWHVNAQIMHPKPRWFAQDLVVLRKFNQYHNHRQERLSGVGC